MYSSWRSVILAYEYLDDDDLGIKLLGTDNYPKLDKEFDGFPLIFKRSEIENTIKTKHPQTLYLRNKARTEDYMIKFGSTKNLGDFLKLFPDRVYDEQKTVGYYFIPYNKYN